MCRGESCRGAVRSNLTTCPLPLSGSRGHGQKGVYSSSKTHYSKVFTDTWLSQVCQRRRFTASKDGTCHNIPAIAPPRCAS